MVQTPFISFYVGDDWPVPVRLTNPDGTPVDLTGSTPIANLIVGKTVIEATTSPQSATSLYTNGQVQFVIPSSVTSTVPSDAVGSTFFATRLQVILQDASGNKETKGVINIRVLVP